MRIKRSYTYLTEAAKRNSIPEPYSKYYEINIEGEKDFPDMLGEVIDGYGCKILHYLIAKPQYEDTLDEPEALLVDDPDYPVVVTAGRRMYPVEVPENQFNEKFSKESLTEAKKIDKQEIFDYLDENSGYDDWDGNIETIREIFGLTRSKAESIFDEWAMTPDEEYEDDEDDVDEDDVDEEDVDEEDEEESSNWLKVISKPVPDADGFLTDYTMYRDLNDPEHYVFVFGDNELYSPDDGDWDWEAFSNEEATEWYNNYEGITDDEEDDADDDFEDSSSGDDFNESFDSNIRPYGFVSKQAFKEFKKLSKLLVKEQNHYDEVLDSLESNANTDESWDSLMADEYYQKLRKVSQDTYEIIHDLSKAFDDGTIYIEDDPYDDRILIDSTLYSVEDLSKLLNDMQDSIK